MAGEARKPDDREAVTGRLKRPVEIGVGKKKPKGTKVTTTPGSAVAQGNLDVSAGRSPQAQDDVGFSREGQPTPDIAFSRGLIPAPDAQVGGDTFILPPEPLPEGAFSFEGGEQPGAGAGVGFTPEDDVAQSIGEAGIAEAESEGVDADTAIAVGEQNRKELEQSPEALNRIRTAPIESLDWKDKLAVAFISLAGGAILGEATGAGAVTGALAGGVGGFGEIKERQDAERKQAFALEQLGAKAAAKDKGSKTKLQLKPVEREGKVAFALFDPSGRILDPVTKEDISADVAPLDPNKFFLDGEGNVFQRGEDGILRKAAVGTTAGGEIILGEDGGVKATPGTGVELTPGAPGTDEPPVGVTVPLEPPPGGFVAPPVPTPPPGTAVDPLTGLPLTQPPTGTTTPVPQQANRFARLGVPIPPDVVGEVAKDTSIAAQLSELEQLEAERSASPGFFPKSKTRRIDSLRKDIRDDIKDIQKRKKDKKEKDEERAKDLDEFQQKSLWNARMSGKLLDKKGFPLTTDKVALVNQLSKQAGDTRYIKVFLDQQINGFERAIKEGNVDLARVTGQNMAKTLNSPLGRDAVSGEEADRMLPFLKNNIFNLTDPGPLLGLDMKNFLTQVTRRSQAMGLVVKGNISQISEITGAKSSLLPTIRTRVDFNLMEAGDRYIDAKDSLRYEKVGENGFKRVR